MDQSIITQDSIPPSTQQLINQMNLFRSLFKFLQPEQLPQPIPQDRNAHIKLPNGSIYTGKLLNGKIQGRGTLVYENGERYQGQFHEGMKHGKGKYYYIRGELYIGDWFENKKHGSGQYFYENGQRYMGEFVNNMKHGEGVLFEQDGCEYRGKFANNKRHGSGQYFDANNDKRYKQVYENGKLIDQQCASEQEKYNTVDLEDNAQQQKNNPATEVNRELFSMQDINNPQRNSFNSFEEPRKKVFDSLMTLSPSAMKEIEMSEEKVERQQKLNTLLFNNNKHIYIWTDDDVCAWLESISFLDYIDSFYREKIDGLALLLLNEEDLKELGVVIGDKKDMIKEIEFLKIVFRVQSAADYAALKQKDFKSFNEVKLALKQKVESSSSSSDEDHFGETTQLLRQESGNSTNSKLQKRVYTYLKKHGIKLNFLIPKDEINIIKEIGKGGFGQVYLGKWLSQDVAVKKYVKKEGLRNRHIGHFIEEVQLISKLLHPSIVLYMGMCIEDNQYAMVTEFLSNGSLFDYLHQNSQQKDLSDDRVFYIVKDVALGMTYLHGKKVLHCDLKSSNVLIDSNWNVKLCDFGLSRIHQPKGGAVRRVGTPHWMAPQILIGQKYTFSSDVYSFGMIIWQLLSQQIPYKNYSAAQIIGMVGRDQSHTIPVPKNSNSMMIELMKMCTRRNQAQRPTFSAIVQYLQKNEGMYLNLLREFDQNQAMR